MAIRISMGNSKLGALIPSINLPPQCSCRPDAPCARLCYGKRGHFAFSQAQGCMAENWREYESDPRGYFRQIADYLNSGLVQFRYFRWHAVGDIASPEYLEGMIRVARECPSVKFLTFTKRFAFVNSWLDAHPEGLPDNLRIVFSAWSRGFAVDNPHSLPVAYVMFRKQSLNPDIDPLAIPCIGKCYECQACWSLKPGQSVVFDQH